MAVLRFDVRTMNIDVIVGVLETYKPSKEIKALQKSLDSFKKDYSKFLKKHFKTEDTKELIEILDKSDEKRDEFRGFMQEVVSPKIMEISKEIERLNKQLCANYTA